MKFLAAILIIFHHFQGDFPYEKSFCKFSGGDVYFGYVVELFFIISGILIGIKNQENYNTPFRVFIGKRLKRLLPMTTFSTVVFMGLVIIYKVLFGIWFSCGPLSPIMILKGLLLLYCGGALQYQNIEPNCVLWYVCVLIICYIVYWLVLFIAKHLCILPRWLFIFVIFLGIGINAYSINLPFLNFYTSRGYMAFFLGVVMVDIYNSVKNKNLLKIGSLMVSGLLVMYAFLDTSLLFSTGMDQELTLTFIIYPTIICVLICFPIFGKIFDNKLIKFLGNISFEMYICQYHVFMIIHILEELDIISFPRTDIGMFIVLGLVIIVSIVAYLLVERPVVKFMKTKSNKI